MLAWVEDKGGHKGGVLPTASRELSVTRERRGGTYDAAPVMMATLFWRRRRADISC